ncbi:concanavalin A-like lectin/glucanase domain-containing protein [Hyaloraphidium curvatum]|nr:concanavalin A-like lectin/glucanase domain-containing protein [Hyaloraphidium curvatum]
MAMQLRAHRWWPIAAGVALAGLAALPPAAAVRLGSEDWFAGNGGRPGCVNTFENFDSPGVLGSAWAVNGASFVNEEGSDRVSIEGGELRIRMVKNYINSYGRWTGAGGTVTWSHLLDTGKVCVRMKAARGGGLVTAFMLSSYTDGVQVDDELDMEVVGGDMFHWQSNFFPQNHGDYCQSGLHDAPGDLNGEFHTFCIERCSTHITWSIDDVPRRTIYRQDLCNDLWPGRPAKVVLATLWDGGTGAPGTALWSGGPTDWSQDTRQPDYRVSIDWFSVRCGCDGSVPPQPGYQQLFDCGFKPGTIDPFTGQPIAASFPTVPGLPNGCWRGWWHPYNGTYDSWHPPSGAPPSGGGGGGSTSGGSTGGGSGGGTPPPVDGSGCPLIPDSGPDYGGTRWQCLRDPSGADAYAPVKRTSYGESACMSTDSRNCIWVPQACCEALVAKGSGRNPFLACGDRHREVWGSTGYEADGWCSRVRDMQF